MLHTLEKQAGNEQVNDGMDISLLRVSTNEVTNEVIWASAKRPLIYFQNHELKELKGSKFPIGSSFYESKVFEQHQIITQMKTGLLVKLIIIIFISIYWNVFEYNICTDN